MYTKYGQIASGMTNTFSTEWIERLRRLEDAVPPRPTSEVEAVVRAELGDAIATLEHPPLGSASIGQARRKDGGSREGEGERRGRGKGEA